MEQEHHLAAILFTDIVGYTALMQRDEALALAVIRRYNAVLEKLVAEHHGKVVNNYGDGSLCTFSSATQAVNCAVQIQKQLQQSEPSVPLRIGLHIGELFFEEEKALGDGVNIASRIQSLGQANTILFSKEIFDKIRNQPGFKSVSLGKFEFKNVDESMEVFALANEGLIIPNRETMEGKLKIGLSKNKNVQRNKIILITALCLFLLTSFSFYFLFFKKSGLTGTEKSIAVLPFINMSNDKENEYFSDGMTEEITTQLSKTSDLKVIARTSAMLYKNSNKPINEIADELGVTTVLEGSVQKNENRIRITAQLINANSQEHIWAEKYDREFKDVFAIQSEVAQEIARQLHATITKTEKESIENAPTSNPAAYKFYLRGRQMHLSFYETHKPEYFENSRTMFEKAIALDSNYALAHAGLADLFNTYSKEDPHIVSLQVQEIEKAWKLDSTNDYIIFIKGTIEQSPLGNKENAFKYFKRGIETNPNNPDNFWGMAMLAFDFGMFDEAKLLFDRSVILDPLTASNYYPRAACNFVIGNFEDAIKDMQTALRLEPDYVDAMDALAWIYASKGRLDEAKKLIDKSFQLKPVATDHLSHMAPAYTYIKLGDKKRALELEPDDWYWLVLLAAGMKEEAINAMKEGIVKGTNNPYLFFKSQLETPDFAIIRNDPRFLRIMEERRKEYEENKKKYSVMNLIAAFSSQ